MADQENILQSFLARGGSIVFDLPEKGFQPQFGSPVVTTSHPDKKKEILLPALSESIIRKKSFLFLIGLGHKGLSPDLFEMAPYHLDITSKGVSLETCTAIGAVPAVISGYVESKNIL